MKIRMLTTISGMCDGQSTHLGAIVDIGDASALDYIAHGDAEAVVEEKVEEKVEEVEIDRRLGYQTAEAAPPQNAAEHVSKPVPRRGPGRPRKQV